MNRTLSLFLTSSVAFLIVLFQVPVFATDYYSRIDGGEFGDANTWTLDTLKNNPVPILEYTNGQNNFKIMPGHTVTISSNEKYLINNLTIGGIKTNFSKLEISSDVDIIEINGNLTISYGSIDFGTQSVNISVAVNLNGRTGSEILQTPAATKTQKLTLNGVNNTLGLYSVSSKSSGISWVIYNRSGNQSIFSSKNYQNLELSGSGIKTLNAPSPIGTEATVNNALTIQDCILQIPYNFNYLGTESNLSIYKGWINTDGSGYYSSNSNDATRTFPVGDAKKMQTLSLSSIAGNKVSVRFGDNTIAPSIPNGGFGFWYVIATDPISTIVSLKPDALLLSSSNIAAAPAVVGAIWKIQETKFTNQTFSTTKTFALSNENTLFSIFPCPTFQISPSILPDAIAGSTYNQTVQISNGTSPYSLVSSNSSVYKLSVPKVSTQDQLNITGTAPTSSAQAVALSFTIQDATGCQSTLSATVNTTIQTTWDGKKWSGVTPNGKTPNVRAIIAGNYSTAEYGKIKASDIIINAGNTLIVSIKDTIVAADSIKNYGKLIGMCGADMQHPSGYAGNIPDYLDTKISPATMNTGIVGQPYSQTFSVYGDPDPEFTIVNYGSLPKNAFDSKTNTVTFTPSTATSVTFEIRYDETNCETTEIKNIKIIELPSPGLSILNIGAKTYGDAAFKVRTYSKSTGTITYEIVSGNSCAEIDETTGVITIKNAGPSPQNIIVVKATQASDGAKYKAATATETFVIKPADGRFIVRNNAFIVGQNKAITVYSRVDDAPILTFDQLSGTLNARVNDDGTVEPLQTGEFSVRISMAATNNHTAFDSTYTFNVITLQKPPVAIGDTITLEMGKDTTFNILDNDLGMTEEIAPNQTDIDNENSGIQVKFYSTEIGNFLIDSDGNLTVLPFSGFIGNGRMAYSIADANGLRSNVAYVEVIVKAPNVVPELKVNMVMTPNGDNINDALVIGNTDISKENSLIIQDEIGNTVYETSNYQNNWEGIDKKGNKLEPGTYFYIFKEKYSGREMKNYIQIVQ